MSSLESCWYMRNQLLRDSDWASMAHSIELRVPLVDIALLKAIAPALASREPPGKREMVRAVRQQIPRAILTRQKSGFAIPVRDWLGDLHPSVPKERGLRGW